MSGLPWLRIPSDLALRPEVRLLAWNLEVNGGLARGLLLNLYTTAASIWPDGDLSGDSPVRIAAALDWEGDPEQLVRALAAAGVLTPDGHIAGWFDDDMPGPTIERIERERAADRQRKRQVRDRTAPSGDVRSPSGDVRDVSDDVRSPSGDVRDVSDDVRSPSGDVRDVSSLSTSLSTSSSSSPSDGWMPEVCVDPDPGASSKEHAGTGSGDFSFGEIRAGPAVPPPRPGEGQADGIRGSTRPDAGPDGPWNGHSPVVAALQAIPGGRLNLEALPDQLTRWEAAHPDVDLAAEATLFAGWCVDRARDGVTGTSYPARGFGSWLERRASEGRVVLRGQPAPHPGGWPRTVHPLVAGEGAE